MDTIIWLSAIVIAFLVVVVLAKSIMRAYIKTPANRAFVRTGGFFRRADAPPKVVMNGGLNLSILDGWFDELDRHPVDPKALESVERVVAARGSRPRSSS